MAAPKKIADVLSELITRRGYGRLQASSLLASAWAQAAGELLARYSRVGQIKRGVLEVYVANSTLVQELTFQKQGILNELARTLPDERITDLRCRVGPIA